MRSSTVVLGVTLLFVFFRRTKFKSVVVLLQFPDKYPRSAIIVELKSKTLPPRLLAKMTELCDQEVKKFLSKPQVGIPGTKQKLCIIFCDLNFLYSFGIKIKHQ